MITNLDILYRVSLLEGQATAMLASTAQLCEKARRTHGLSKTATAALGRFLTLSGMTASRMKEGSLTVTVQGDGPIGRMIAVAKPDGTVKGCVDDPTVELPRKNGKLDVGGAVGREGRLTVVRDMGLREPYVGQVKLQSGEIGEDMAYYYTVSEQTPSLVSVGVLVKEQVIAAGGLVIQPLPGCSEAALQSLEMTAPLCANLSDTLLRLGAEETLYDLLGHLQPVVLETGRLQYQCDCSRERVERALISLGEKELEDMIAEQGGAEVGCQFCGKKRQFTADELRALLEAARNRASDKDDGSDE